MGFNLAFQGLKEMYCADSIYSVYVYKDTLQNCSCKQFE